MPGVGADQIRKPITHIRRGLVPPGTQVAIDALNRFRILAGEHRAGLRRLAPVMGSRLGEHRCASRASAIHRSRARGSRSVRASESSGATSLSLRPMRSAAGRSEQPRHGGIQDLDPLIHIDRDHAIAQLAENGIQTFALRAPSMRDRRAISTASSSASRTASSEV